MRRWFRIAALVVSLCSAVTACAQTQVYGGGGSPGSGGAGVDTTARSAASAAQATANAALPANGCTTASGGKLNCPGSTSGGSPSAAAQAALPSGTQGFSCDETNGSGTPATGVDYARCDANTHRLVQSLNGLGEFPFSYTVATGSTKLATAQILANTCQPVTQGSVNSTAAPAVVNGDTLDWLYSGSVTSIVGFSPASTGALKVTAYITNGYVNFDVCNGTASPITPGAVVTINWRVAR